MNVCVGARTARRSVGWNQLWPSSQAHDRDVAFGIRVCWIAWVHHHPTRVPAAAKTRYHAPPLTFGRDELEGVAASISVVVALAARPIIVFMFRLDGVVVSRFEQVKIQIRHTVYGAR